MNDCRGELLARVRRGLGTDQDRIALEAHLQSCPSCALSHEVGENFEAVGTAGPGDGELVLRLAERVAAEDRVLEKARRAALPTPILQLVGTDEVQPPARASTGLTGRRDPKETRAAISCGKREESRRKTPPRRGVGAFFRSSWWQTYRRSGAIREGGTRTSTKLPRYKIARLALAAALLGGVAAAGVVMNRQPTTTRKLPSPQTETRDESPAPPSPRDSVPPRREPKATDTVDLESSPPADTPRSNEEIGARVPPPAPSVKPNSAELYRRANLSRRKGSTAEAIALYQDLQKRYPGSTEANLSRVSLGSLLLAGGANTSALTQYDAYLKTSDGRLRAEALYGRGRALQKLGRTEEETETWRRLLATYPSSAYATHAQNRITKLAN